MLIFDFDGVLMNSLAEVTLTAYSAATGKRVPSLADLPTALAGLFQHNRFHVQRIGDAILLMNWCLNHYRAAPHQILAPHEYEALIAGEAVPITDRTLRIYETRSQFIADDPESWLALHEPYQPLWDELIGFSKPGIKHPVSPATIRALRAPVFCRLWRQNPSHPLCGWSLARRSNSVFVILTNKNRDATLRLCDHFGLGIQAADVYSGDDGRSKVENMRQIQKRYPDQPFGFIDDSVKNLRELEQSSSVDKKKIQLMLASWGYTGPGDQEFALKYGYTVLNQKDLIAMLD